MRGKTQLLYLGQPFIFEKTIRAQDGNERNIWRCNQWWNEKCRARVYTVDNKITPLNKYHTHSEIINRKRRVVKKKDGPVKAEPSETVSVTINF
jgi:hypothetical protein